MEKELSMQEIQQASFQVLLKVKEICDKNHFTYHLAFGTLIGAIRHKGFIPWDDDIDITMERSEYEKLINYLIDNPDELKPFELLHHRTNKKYIYPIARVSDPRYRIDYENAKEYGLGCFIDIYPLDGRNPNDKRHIKKMMHLNSIIYVAGQKKLKKARNFLRNIPKAIIYVYSRFISLNKLLAKNDKKAQKYAYGSTSETAAMVIEADRPMKQEYFKEVTEVEFEGVKFTAPKEYDKLLRDYYGDYMQLPPEEERIGHHYYKVFKKSND